MNYLATRSGNLNRVYSPGKSTSVMLKVHYGWLSPLYPVLVGGINYILVVVRAGSYNFRCFNVHMYMYTHTLLSWDPHIHAHTNTHTNTNTHTHTHTNTHAHTHTHSMTERSTLRL